jgi:ribosomal protein S18 acetylase RimI-like enzyme
MEPELYSVIRLPKLQDYNGPDANQLAEKLRELRLLALKTDPGAFASSYEVEVEKVLQHTLQRLESAQANHFVAAQGTFNADDILLSDLLSARWVGMIVLFGPLAEQISAKSDPLHQIKSEVSFGRYHLNGIFVHAGMRRTGMGRALIAAALAKGRADAASRGENFHCTIMVDSENAAASQLYKSFGFRVTGTETFFQQARSSLYREAERVAIVMELH